MREGGFLVLDLTGWGWTLLIWGALLVLGGLGLLAGQGWARWFAIVVVGLNFIAQLGFLGNTQYTLWSLTVIALNIIVLYALTARWSDIRNQGADVDFEATSTLLFQGSPADTFDAAAWNRLCSTLR